MDIGIFPDTGHHYRFLPLNPEFLATHPDIKESCEQDRGPWKEHENLPWVRYRHGQQAVQGAEKQLGIWLAIESNLGSRNRGYVYDPRGAIPPRPLEGSGYSHLATPYAFHSARDIPSEPMTVTLYDDFDIARLIWQQPSTTKPVEVDLIVDFGNTRSVALLLEDNRGFQELAQICHPVRFTKRACEYTPNVYGPAADDPLVIVDSWLVLHEGVFADFEPPSPGFRTVEEFALEERETGIIIKKKVKYLVAKTVRLPQMFVELSPALLGGGVGAGSARQVLLTLDLKRGGHYFLSSPKRYAWDDRPRGEDAIEFWTMACNPWSKVPAARRLPQLQGPILLFMDPDGRDGWTIGEAPRERLVPVTRPHADADPVHPNGDALCWAALAILEKAYAQMNCENYRRELGNPFVPRKLRYVMVTFPAGWTAEELACYRRKWEKAIRIFTLGHLADPRLRREGGDQPELVMDVDEAVASQLPVIFSEMQHMTAGESWFELVGCGKGVTAAARIMNIDIGGGTTDVSIVEYCDSEPGVVVNLDATLLFRNSTTCGGDALVRRVVEQILLPLLTRELVKRTNDGTLPRRIRNSSPGRRNTFWRSSPRSRGGWRVSFAWSSCRSSISGSRIVPEAVRLRATKVGRPARSRAPRGSRSSASLSWTNSMNWWVSFCSAQTTKPMRPTRSCLGTGT